MKPQICNTVKLEVDYLISHLEKIRKTDRIRVKLMRILLSCYSFGANRGSEAGVGWNVARGMALRGHQVTVLTTSEFSKQNKEAIQSENLKVTLKEEDCGITHFPSSHSYAKWQRHIGPTIRQELSTCTYDVIHHVTFNQYRGIRDVFAGNIPYLIGPVGGAELIAPSLLKYGDLPFGFRLKEIIRYCALDVVPLVYRCKKHSSKGIILASNNITADRLTHFPLKTLVCPAIAIHEHEIVASPEKGSEQQFILFDGGISRPQKGTFLALRTLKKLWESGCRVPLRMVGIASSEHQIINNYAKQINLPGAALQLLPHVSRNSMLQFMQEASVMLSTVYRDSGSMALLEALSQGCRIVCLDIPSQEWLDPDFAHKVPIMSTSEKMELALSAALHQEISDIAKTAAWHEHRYNWLKKQMTWEARLNLLEILYQDITKDR